jgi:hypothetical protein
MVWLCVSVLPVSPNELVLVTLFWVFYFRGPLLVALVPHVPWYSLGDVGGGWDCVTYTFHLCLGGSQTEA